MQLVHMKKPGKIGIEETESNVSNENLGNNVTKENSMSSNCAKIRTYGSRGRESKNRGYIVEVLIL